MTDHKSQERPDNTALAAENSIAHDETVASLKPHVPTGYALPELELVAPPVAVTEAGKPRYINAATRVLSKPSYDISANDDEYRVIEIRAFKPSSTRKARSSDDPKRTTRVYLQIVNTAGGESAIPCTVSVWKKSMGFLTPNKNLPDKGPWNKIHNNKKIYLTLRKQPKRDSHIPKPKTGLDLGAYVVVKADIIRPNDTTLNMVDKDSFGLQHVELELFADDGTIVVNKYPAGLAESVVLRLVQTLSVATEVYEGMEVLQDFHVERRRGRDLEISVPSNLLRSIGAFDLRDSRAAF